MAEMCPPQIRGAVLSAKETVIVGGIVLGYATGNFMSGIPQRWTGKQPRTIEFGWICSSRVSRNASNAMHLTLLCLPFY
jgi:hypothetical protein